MRWVVVNRRLLPVLRLLRSTRKLIDDSASPLSQSLVRDGDFTSTWFSLAETEAHSESLPLSRSSVRIRQADLLMPRSQSMESPAMYFWAEVSIPGKWSFSSGILPLTLFGTVRVDCPLSHSLSQVHAPWISNSCCLS